MLQNQQKQEGFASVLPLKELGWLLRICLLRDGSDRATPGLWFPLPQAISALSHSHGGIYTIKLHPATPAMLHCQHGVPWMILKHTFQNSADLIVVWKGLGVKLSKVVHLHSCSKTCQPGLTSGHQQDYI